MVLLFFGSGHPSTNGLIAYDPSEDTFHQLDVSFLQEPLLHALKKAIF
jgi:hypothetical protein